MSNNRLCFVIMPFGKYGTDEYERNLKIYQMMIKPVLQEYGYETRRADEFENMGNITQDIIENLHQADLVVADLSGRNANVFYELGVRHALRHCGTIPIIREGETLPFDIANYRAIFYSSELDGPDKFKRELRRRVEAFEKLKEKRSDNPVHDILKDKLMFVSLDEFVEKRKYEEKLKELASKNKELESTRQIKKVVDRKEKDFLEQIQLLSGEKNKAKKRAAELEKQLDKLKAEFQQACQELREQSEKVSSTPKPTAIFRNEPGKLSEDDVKAMLKKYDFYCGEYDWSKKYCNPKGNGFKHQFEAKTIKGDKVVFDEASGLIWQQSGSSDSMTYDEAKNYIKELNEKGFAGYKDWRLPTLEEAMSLMEAEKKRGNLYIDPVFDNKQEWIWISDLYQGESRAAWVVSFSYGRCNWNSFFHGSYVRAVRSGQSSQE